MVIVSNTPETLCQLCGLCCDGTLFDRVNLESTDDVVALQAAGLAVVAHENGPTFNQPCACYQNGSCRIYGQRPSSCSGYHCILLQRYERNDISFEDARSVIERTLRRRQALYEQLESAGVGAGEAVNSRLAATVGAIADPLLSLNYGAFQIHLKRYFGDNLPSRT